MTTSPDITSDPEPDPRAGQQIDIAIIDARWEAALPDLDALCTLAAAAAASVLNAPQTAELSVAFMDDAHIQTLNAQYRDKDKPTNVLSFPADGHNPAMGDIALAYETCVREAAAKPFPLRDHTAHLLIHGYLHLSGYDHLTDSDAAVMEALEIGALAKLGMKNPYEDHNV